MKKTLSMVAALTLACSSPLFAADNVLRVAADLSYPPFQYRDASGTPTGFEIDITNAVCKAVNITCEYVVSSFDAEIPSLMAKKVDFISPLGATEKRRKSIDFSDFIYHIPTKLVARKGSNLQPDEASLQGKHIAVQQGSIQEMYVNKFCLALRYSCKPLAYCTQRATGRVMISIPISVSTAARFLGYSCYGVSVESNAASATG